MVLPYKHQHLILNPPKEIIINVIAVVLEITNTKKELVRFLHTTCFYPIRSTWISVIKNRNYAIFLELTAELVSKYLLIEVPTILGYLHKYK